MEQLYSRPKASYDDKLPKFEQQRWKVYPGNSEATWQMEPHDQGLLLQPKCHNLQGICSADCDLEQRQGTQGQDQGEEAATDHQQTRLDLKANVVVVRTSKRYKVASARQSRETSFPSLHRGNQW